MNLVLWPNPGHDVYGPLPHFLPGLFIQACQFNDRITRLLTMSSRSSTKSQSQRLSEWSSSSETHRDSQHYRGLLRAFPRSQCNTFPGIYVVPYAVFGGGEAGAEPGEHVGGLQEQEAD